MLALHSMDVVRVSAIVLVLVASSNYFLNTRLFGICSRFFLRRPDVHYRFPSGRVALYCKKCQMKL